MDMEEPIHIQPADWNDPRTRDMVGTHFTYFTQLEVGTTFNDPPSLDEYIESLRGPNDTVLIAWNKSYDSILGCGALKILSSPITGHDGKQATGAGEVRTMHTLAAARGQGVGQKLLQQIEKIARDADLTRLYIETGTLDGYISARRLYAKAGFKQCGVFGRYSEHPDIYCMVKEL